LGHYIYIWLKNRRQFWFYPTDITPVGAITSVGAAAPTHLTGYVWYQNRWIPGRVRLKMIENIY
jgi:hypothetical protein